VVEAGVLVASAAVLRLCGAAVATIKHRASILRSLSYGGQVGHSAKKLIEFIGFIELLGLRAKDEVELLELLGLLSYLS
jgi:hypothetical protein